VAKVGNLKCIVFFIAHFIQYAQAVVLLYMPIARLTDHEEFIGKQVIHAAYRIHQKMGPGLLEKIYEACLFHELVKAELSVGRQLTIPIVYDGVTFEEGLRLDLLVEHKVIVEVKAIETVNPVWQAQVLSHLKLTGLRLGYVINFHVPLIKDGIKRIIL
jgi:GxxExxY protein